MKRLSIVIASLVVSAAVVFAHEGNEHIRGVVTNIAPKAITIQTPEKATKTLTLTAKTTVQAAGKPARLADLKVGDRVVVDVRGDSTEALSIQVGAASPVPAAEPSASKPLNIAFQTVPKAPKTGENTFEVVVKDAAGAAVADVDVSVVLSMPAMPAMGMPAIRNEVKLKAAGAGSYTGTGQIPASGNWTVSVSVKRQGTEIGQKKLTLTAR